MIFRNLSVVLCNIFHFIECAEAITGQEIRSILFLSSCLLHSIFFFFFCIVHYIIIMSFFRRFTVYYRIVLRQRSFSKYRMQIISMNRNILFSLLHYFPSLRIVLRLAKTKKKKKKKSGTCTNIILRKYIYIYISLIGKKTIERKTIQSTP